jgi:hypothetical protein
MPICGGFCFPSLSRTCPRQNSVAPPDGLDEGGAVSTQIFRVTVRGRFDDLAEEARSALLAVADDHDALHARFTPEGTLTYDRALDFFSFRVEVRQQGEDGGGDLRDQAFDQARDQAAALLERWGAGYRALKATGSNMADVWQGR